MDKHWKRWLVMSGLVDPQSAPSADVAAASLFRLITPALLQADCI
jgi:hypothetical protein